DLKISPEAMSLFQKNIIPGYDYYTQNNKDKLSIKLTIIGDGGVGKSCLLLTITTKSFPNYMGLLDYNVTAVDINGVIVDAYLWDTCAQEEYDRLRPLTYIGTDVFFVCFSLTKRISFDNVSLKWVPEIK